MKKILFLLLLLPLMVSAQTYKYIGVEDGLSNRRVYYIQKDKKGYMWFLTHEGVDRYDGKEFKRYKLMDDGEELNSLLNLNWLYISGPREHLVGNRKERKSVSLRPVTRSVHAGLQTTRRENQRPPRSHQLQLHRSE